MASLSINDVISYLRAHKHLLMERFGVTRIGIFGSFVHQTQTDASDIDLVIEMEKDKKNLHTFLGVKRFLENGLSRRIDMGIESSLKPFVREKIKDQIIYV
jgi:predicted nucleotidyltransferase